MYFSNMGSLIRMRSEDPQYPIENKQRVNLSAHARYILQNDSAIFLKTSPAAERTSRIINDILTAYASIADASIAHRLAARQAEYNYILQEVPAKELCCKELLNAYRGTLVAKSKSMLSKKGVSLSFRFNKQNLEYLACESCQQEGPFYQDQIGKYVKAIVEEYAEKPYVERERIYCQAFLKEFQNALHDKKLLKITLTSRNRATGLNNVKYMKPCGIYQDEEVLYNYLVGYVSEGPHEDFTIGSVRLSSVSRCETRSVGASLSREEIRQLENRIEEKGVQFLPEDLEEQEIQVLLTEEGKKMYSRIFHLRPMYTATQPENPNIYIFHCSVRQAENYFFNFGHNAKILSPVYLREKMKRKYESAARKYEESASYTIE